VGHRCVARSRRNAGHRACRLTVTAGTLTFAGHPGSNKVLFQGRLSSRRLVPGRYTLVITASDTAGRSTPVQLTFTIVR
jgi:hypothetical protein